MRLIYILFLSPIFFSCSGSSKDVTPNTKTEEQIAAKQKEQSRLDSLNHYEFNADSLVKNKDFKKAILLLDSALLFAKSEKGHL